MQVDIFNMNSSISLDIQYISHPLLSTKHLGSIVFLEYIFEGVKISHTRHNIQEDKNLLNFLQIWNKQLKSLEINGK